MQDKFYKYNFTDLDLSSLENVARCFANNLRKGEIVIFSGDLGSGKTSFIRAIIKQKYKKQTDVPSPSFPILITYDDIKPNIWHIDLYRLKDNLYAEMINLGIMEALGKHILLIEWGEKIIEFIPNKFITVKITYGDDNEKRNILIESFKKLKF